MWNPGFLDSKTLAFNLPSVFEALAVIDDPSPRISFCVALFQSLQLTYDDFVVFCTSIGTVWKSWNLQ